jgi:cystathionine gamma-synthase
MGRSNGRLKCRVPAAQAVSGKHIDVSARASSADVLLQVPLNGNGSSNGKSHNYPPEHNSSTLSVHGGEGRTRLRQGVADSLTVPIIQTAAYTFQNTQELIDYKEGRRGSYQYGRYGNPTTRTVEEKIMALEGAEDCLLSSSGMCSATTMLLALVPPGGHIIATTDCYRRTRQFIQTVLPQMGRSCTVIDPSDVKALERALEENKTSLFFSESPTNPYLRCIDIKAVSNLCHAAGAIVCVDSTFASPSNCRALDFGADLVIHSATKYLAGHNDVLAGAICGRQDLISQIRNMHNIMGGVMDPHGSYLLLRGMKTLDLRVQRQNQSAMELARRLEAHPKVSCVHYPGLESHRDHAIAKKQMKGFGGVVSFEIKGDLWKTASFIDGCELPYIAPSLGGVESLIEQPAIISYWNEGPERRAEIGIKDNLVRFSCGIESLEDIWADIEQALSRI